MMKSALDSGQRRTFEIIDALGFGFIEHLRVHKGFPCFEPSPRIVQSIKLDSEPIPRRNAAHDDLTLKKEFETLFNQLNRLHEGVVDIEVRHSLPFRLVLERPPEALL